jgi:phosphoribosylamine-glycine ligase
VFIDAQPGPVVVKADGLAAGKGRRRDVDEAGSEGGGPRHAG